MQRILNANTAGSLSHILNTFALSLLIAFLGMIFGSLFVPISIIPIIIVIELIMILSVVFIRIKERNIGYGFLYTFTGLSGITLYPVIMQYSSKLGANLLSLAFITTTLIFSAISYYAYKSKKDFSFLYGFLIASLIGLLIMSLASLFIDFGGTLYFFITIFGILLFSGFILYDISIYKNGVSPEEVPLAALNLYLDFINLFLYVLRFFGILSDD